MKTTLLFLFAFSFAAFPQQNFWEQTNGPNGGQVNSLTIDKNGYIFAGTINGVYRSSDNGNN